MLTGRNNSAETTPSERRMRGAAKNLKQKGDSAQQCQHLTKKCRLLLRVWKMLVDELIELHVDDGGDDGDEGCHAAEQADEL